MEEVIHYSEEDLKKFESETPEKEYAFVEKTEKGFVVKKGNTGEVLGRFTGENAEKRAKEMATLLHKKHNPLQKNRGKVAEKRETSKENT